MKMHDTPATKTPRTLALAAGLLASAATLAAGCTGYSERMLNRPGPRSPGPAPDVTIDAVNSTRLNSLPPVAQASFQQQYPGAAVTAVQPEPTGTGTMRYKVVFIQDGKSAQVVYRGDGSEVGADDLPVISRPDESFVPLRRPGAAVAGPTSREIQ